MLHFTREQWVQGLIKRCLPSMLAAGLLAPMAAMACTPNPSNVIDHASWDYDDVSAGEAITDWQSRTVYYLRQCAEKAIIDMTVASFLESAGDFDGYEAFKTSNPNIGVQFRYSYASSRAVDGTITMSPWINLTSDSNSIRVYGDRMVEVTKSSFYLDMQIRFVALNSISGDQVMARVQPIQVTLDSESYSINQIVWEGISLVAPRKSVCSFDGDVDGWTVNVPDTHVTSLREEDDMGPAANFSWSWKCDGGAGTGANPNGDFRYSATTTVDDKASGRMSVTGGARGVDLLVTRRGDDGEQEPIEFDYWYSNDKELGLSGTEHMQVRFIRNADPLVAGEAEAGLLIKIEPQ